MPKPLPLIIRLTRQLAADNVPKPHDGAVRILRERGHVYKNSERLTLEGKKREAMGPVGRAIDRAAKASGRPKSYYKFSGGRVILK